MNSNPVKTTLDKVSSVKTPCIGVCSTTSVGDAICRGCKRYAFEVIRWNGYSDVEKEAVLRRIEALTVQIMQDKFVIASAPLLEAGVAGCRLPVNPVLSPYCWLHTLLQKGPLQTVDLTEFGVGITRDFQHLTLEQLASLVNEELLVLCDAHFERYFREVNSLA